MSDTIRPDKTVILKIIERDPGTGGGHSANLEELNGESKVIATICPMICDACPDVFDDWKKFVVSAIDRFERACGSQAQFDYSKSWKDALNEYNQSKRKT